MEKELYLLYLTTNEAIREYLLTMGEGYSYGFWKIWRQFKKKTSYASIRRNFWILKELRLIESVRFEKDKTPFRKHIYRIVPGMEDDPRWMHPEEALWPSKG